MTLKVCLVVATVVSVACAAPRPRPDNPQPYGPPPPQQAYPAPQPPSYPAPHPSPYKEEPKPYAFDYGVKDDYTGANFGHKENSDGNAITGSYKVALPDGRIQTVNYIADHYNGFQAEVKYEGEANYPAHPAPAPYAPPPSSYPPPPQPSYPAPPPPSYPAPPAYPPPPVYPADPYAREQLAEDEGEVVVEGTEEVPLEEYNN